MTTGGSTINYRLQIPMQTHNISFPYQARYQQLGELTDETKELVYVIHGYGQLSQYFIRKFSKIVSPKRAVIAPEGLSRFYLAGFDGRVGATWMTREDRETDIRNYITYLNAIHSVIKPQLKGGVKITAIGFSQGAATVTRWLMDGEIHADRLILWAGILPFDLDLENASQHLGELDRICVYGTKDPYLTDKKMDEMTDLAGRTNLSFTYLNFEGGHDIDQELLTGLFTDY